MQLCGYLFPEVESGQSRQDYVFRVAHRLID